MSITLKCLSHTPLRGLNDPGAEVVAEVDAVLAQARAEVEAFDPELIVIFAPDHYNGLFYDLMPPFVIATAAESVGDYQTPLGSLSIPQDLALDLAKHILNSDIDIALSHRPAGGPRLHPDAGRADRQPDPLPGDSDHHQFGGTAVWPVPPGAQAG